MSNEDLTIHKWIHENGFVNEKAEPIAFNDHMFLFEPYRDFSQYQVYKKCSQVGVSVMMNLKCFFAMMKFRWNIIYTLPADKDVYEFVPTKTDKIIMSNPVLKQELQTDKMELKQMYDRFLHMKGTRSKSAAIMTTADLLIHDEKDRSDLTIVGDYRSRIKRSNYRGIWELSNPSVANAGVDVMWKHSDRKEWAITCPRCRKEHVMIWDKCVDYQKKMFVCMHCGGEISDNIRRLGKWVAGNPESKISGYHISQMMAPWMTADDLIYEQDTTDEDYFYNFILGEPVGGGDAENFRQLIVDAWTPKNLDAGPYYMGIDIGGTKHYVIGNKNGIFRIGKCRTREEVETLIEDYNPTVVMDGGPERTWAEEFRNKYPKLWLNFYQRDKKKKRKIWWLEGKDAGIVHSDRSRVIDAVVNAIVFTDIQFDLKPEDLDRYIKHWEVMTRKKEEDGMGLPVFIWDKNSAHAQDHWVHATVYYWIARTRGQSAEVLSSPEGEKKKSLIQVSDGGEHKMQDLKSYLEGLER